MEKMRVRITGVSGLMQHNGQLANPFNPFAQKLAELNKEKSRKGQDKLPILRQMAEVEWEGGLYHDAKIGPFVPASMLLACIQEGAKLTKGGRTVARAVSISPAKVPVQYDGPRDIEGLRVKPEHRDQRMVAVQTSKVLRTRPVFPEWSLECDILFNPEGIKDKDLLKYVEDAGQFEGLGEGRGKCGFGRFTVEVIK